MSVQILTIIASVLTCIIGLWRYFKRKKQFRREQAEKAKKELDNANQTGNPSDLLDAFGRMQRK